MSHIYKIKDSIDMYLVEDTIIAYFMNTKLQKKFKVNKLAINILQQIDGEKTIEEISLKLHIDVKSVHEVCERMEKAKIVQKLIKLEHILDSEEIIRFDRQLNYFSEFFNSKEEALNAQKKLKQTKFLIFGVGSVGSNIVIQLVMAGATNITLLDYDLIEESDTSRHIFFEESMVGELKINSLKEELLKINKNINITLIQENVFPDSNIKKYIDENDFVINTLDEPYIGYTSSKISRICTPLKKPHYIAGGFDAHLASTGELIIPGVTPCVECYTKHFKTALKGWKPIVHPVVNRFNEIGGLASMTLFSASYAVIEIIKYVGGLVELNNNFKTRGELSFYNLNINYLNVDRNHECEICKELFETI